ncbi:MAG TPA: serine/threonine-protein kinase, partial [Longimicrobium sp.]
MRQSGFDGLPTGHTFADRYRVEEVIGQGSFAAVYRATDLLLGHPVAVRVIARPESAEDGDEVRKAFQREAGALAALHHPNLVAVYDFGTDPGLGLDFVVMEPVQGEALSDRLRRSGDIPFAEALRILLDAAAGVEAGHNAGLVHRNLKPGNILLAPSAGRDDFRVYVLDFGVARFTARDAGEHTRSGRSYASPEQLRGDRELTPASDVFSLGAIGYQLLGHEKPFPRKRLRGRGETDAPVVPLRELNP